MNLKKLTKVFKALANERRLKILKLLLRVGKLTVGEISREIKLSFRSTSKHLKILESAGFVDYKQENTNVYYFVSSNMPEDILKLIK